MKATILAVDDNSDALFALRELLSANGYAVVEAGSGAETLERLQDSSPDLVLLDINMPPPDGLEITRRMRADPVWRYIPILLLTAKDSFDDVIAGFEEGADDYIRKPFHTEELLARIQAALRTKRLYGELRSVSEDNAMLRRRLGEECSFAGIVGQSRALRAVFDVIEKVKDADVPVLIAGESGTGKELIASAIHFNSSRRNRPLVAQNCSALNENLLESELFGHVKGAFTGALRDKQGLFESADRGTLFLDELGEMPASLQAKLLRVLQDGCFNPVGSVSPRKADVRIVAATNRDLRAMISEGKFREDLFYRLNVIAIHLPPLRERAEDIPLLVDSFLEHIASRTKKQRKAFSEAALQVLCDYSWPGNIRELQNEVERAVLLSGLETVVQPEILSPHIARSPGLVSVPLSQAAKLRDAITQLERSMISKTLEQCGGNKSEAARELGISRSNLIAKVQEYGLE